MIFTKKILKSFVLAAALLGGTGRFEAVHANAEVGQGDLTLEEVVVTARRREEGVEHVPATINVINAAAIVEQGIHTETDLQSAVSGLVIREGPNPSLLNYVIRGESLDNYSGSIPGVQPYTNEVPLSSNSPTSFYDIENIQVLKGPQGTLFGRNTTGGAVLYQTTRPKNEFGGYFSVQYGNLDRLITEGAVNLPVVDDKVLLRLAGTYTSGGAYIHNLYSGQELGDRDEQSGRITLLLKPIDGLSNLTTIEYSNFGGTPTAQTVFSTIPCGKPNGTASCSYVPANPGFQSLINPANIGLYIPGYPNGYVYPGGIATLGAFLRTFGPYTVDQNGIFEHTGSNKFLSNTTTYDFSSQVTLKNTFGYGNSLTGNRYSNNFEPYAMLQAAAVVPGGPDKETEQSRVISDELQLQGKALDDRLNYILGLYYEHEKDDLSSPLDGAGLAGDAVYTFAIRYHIKSEEKTRAIFTQETFALTDKLNVTAGIRGAWVTLGSAQADGSVLYGVGNPHQETTESKPSWNVTVDYRFNTEFMAYVATRGSWRIGGYNPTAVPVGNDTTAGDGGNYFLPETVKDVEVGVKYNGAIGGMPLQVNMDAYNVWVNDIQKTGYAQIDGISQSSTVNIPTAIVRGIETDFQIAPIAHVRLGGNFSLNDAEFRNNLAPLFGVYTTFGPYGDAPRYSGSLFAEVNTPLADHFGSLTYRIDAYAQSSFYFSNTDNSVTPGTQAPGYLLGNARIDWANPLGATGFTASLFVKNLANRLYYSGGTGSAQSTSFEAALPGPPRTYGVVLRYTF